MTYSWNLYDFFMRFGLTFRPKHMGLKIGSTGGIPADVMKMWILILGSVSVSAFAQQATTDSDCDTDTERFRMSYYFWSGLVERYSAVMDY
jgi:hypothetical protein